MSHEKTTTLKLMDISVIFSSLIHKKISCQTSMLFSIVSWILCRSEMDWFHIFYFILLWLFINSCVYRACYWTINYCVNQLIIFLKLTGIVFMCCLLIITKDQFLYQCLGNLSENGELITLWVLIYLRSFIFRTKLKIFILKSNIGSDSQKYHL